MGVEHGQESAVSYLLEQVKTEVKTFLREPPLGEQPMLPKLADMLSDAAGHDSGSGITQDYLDEFKAKLAGVLPANFTPQGSGALKVLVSYPASTREPMIEGYLKSSVNLPAGVHDFRNTHTESISVVLFRTGMGVTEVGEVRDVLRRWSGALTHPQPTDMLRWRQRTGYDFGYLATREVHRVEILHRLLCAMWNGRASVENDPESPDRIDVTLEGDVTMTLPLTPLRDASSWGSLLPAYELWALDDNPLHRAFCEQLMQIVPDGIKNKPVPPANLYRKFREITGREITELKKLLDRQSGEQQSRTRQMLSFWETTLPAALDRNFTGVSAPVERNLRELERAAGMEDAEIEDAGIKADSDGADSDGADDNEVE